MLAGIESLIERIRECNNRIERLARESYPHVVQLKQVNWVGTLIALEDAHRFRKSRDVGCYLGLQPGRRNSGQSEPQMHVSKEGDPYLRTLLVQGAHHILGWSRQRSAPWFLITHGELLRDSAIGEHPPSILALRE